MKLQPEGIGSFSHEQFRRFGIVCYRRVAYLSRDKRLAKALQNLEQSLGPPVNDRARRDAFNAANSAYLDIARRDGDFSIEAAVACTLVCACESGPNANLLGNFESALSRAEGLSLAEVRNIERELLKQIDSPGPD